MGVGSLGDARKVAAMTERRLINQGSSFEEEMAYSRAVRVGPWVLVSGTTGFDYRTMTISGEVREQAEQAFEALVEILVETVEDGGNCGHV